MPQYYLDTNVFIQAKNGPYGFDIVPAFWDWLDDQATRGIIYSSSLVYSELADGGDELADWVKLRKNSGFFVTPDSEAQKIFQDIANYVNTNFPAHNAQPFLDCADPWVISQSIATSSTVVTHEVLVPPNSQKVKIPNICRQFNIQHINPYQMMRDLNARFTI